MPWSGSAGSKTFSRTDGTRTGSTTWQQADAASVDIVSNHHDTHDQDLADGINSSLQKDGGNTATANIPMGGFTFTNLAAATARTNPARFSDLQDGKGIYVPTVSGTNTITLTTGYTVSAYAAGQRFSFIVGTTNTGATTVNVDSLGAKSLVRSDGSHTALAAGDLVAGAIADIEYDGTRFHLMTANAAGTSGDVLARIVKVGSVLPWPMTTVPSGWLEADGSAISRTTYAELFAVYGTAYGVGDGSTTFNIPNYKDYFLRGFDASGTDAGSRTDRGDGTTGAAVGTKQASAILRHNHTASVTDPGHVHAVPADTSVSRATGADAFTGISGTENSGSATTGISVTIANTSANDSTSETRSKNITVKWIILALPAAASASSLGVNGFLYNWDTGTSDADPGSGKLRVNHATLSSATQLYINETGANSESLASILATWDDSTSTIKGNLYIYKVGAPGTYAYFQVTGSITDAGSYDKFSLTYIANAGTLANGDNVTVLFIRNGDKGDTGATGAAGADAGIRFTFDNSTSMADPGTGDLRLNNASFASVTAIAVDDNSADTGNPDVSPIVLAWDDSTSTVRGTLTIKKVSAPENFATYSISGASTDNSGWTELAVAHVASNGSFSAADVLSVAFTRTGDLGTTGAAGITPATQLTYSATTTDSDPGAGIWRFNNATLASVTAAYIDNTDSSGNTITGWLDSFDDNNDTNRRGIAEWRDISDPTTYAKYLVTGSVVDGTGYRKLTLTHLSSAGTFAGLAAFTFAPAGDKGADGAGAGDVTAASSFGTDNVLIRSDGTGKGVQSTGITVADTTNDISGTGFIKPASNDGGALGDATHGFSDLFGATGFVLNIANGNAVVTHSSGIFTVSTGDWRITTAGTNSASAVTVGGTQTLTNKTLTSPVIGTSPTAAGSTWTDLGTVTTADINGGTIDGAVIGGSSAAAGTFTAIVGTSLSVGTGGVATAGTIELGAASDTTISRSAAGVIAVEGVPIYSNIPQNSQSAAYTLVLGDAQKHILHPSSDNNARTFTIPANASVAYPIGTAITFVNKINTVTIAITSDTLTFAGAGTTGSRTLAANGMATAIKIDTTEWMISGSGLT